MTEAQKKEILSLLWGVVNYSYEWGRSRGMQEGIDGAGWFKSGENSDDVITERARITERFRNELLVLLGMPEHQEHAYTSDHNIE